MLGRSAPTGLGNTVSTRILFVDDEPQVRNAFLRRFRSRGWSVDVAAGADEALRLLRTREYEVLVTDLRMPKVDGLTLIEQAHTIQPFLGCVIVTGLPDLDLNSNLQRDSAIVSILPKPWDEDDLLSAIDHARAVYDERSGRSAQTSNDELTILLIEDNPGDAMLVKRYLKTGSAAPHVVVAERLSDALDRLQNESYDVVLADLSLPDARGLDCIRRLSPEAKDAALIVLTGLEDETIPVRALNLGAQDYLPKGDLTGPLLTRAIRYAMERKRVEQRMTTLACRDAMTGLWNRAAFNDRLRHALNRAKRSKEAVALLFVDLDEFKPINDTFGHDAGDLVIRDTAARIQDAVREYDVVARLGGDEFAVLITQVDDPTTPSIVAQRILENVTGRIPIGNASVAVTASVGIACSPEAGETPEQLVKSADFAMYAAKRGGRNMYRSFEDVDDPRSARRQSLVADLRASLDQDRYVLHYQPQFGLWSGKPVGAEALLRWRREDGSLVSPAEFIPLLEETGLIVDVGAYVLQEACRRLARWHADGATHMRVSVNLSAKQFDSEGLTQIVDAAIREAGIPPPALELEITESLVMRDTQITERTLREIADLGVRIALDDFGTGYSSLAYLERFDVDVLKIDRSFVSSLRPDQAKRGSLASAIIDLGHRLGLEVVAEGVETTEQLDCLRADGCDVVQGYLLGRPSEAWSPHVITSACA